MSDEHIEVWWDDGEMVGKMQFTQDRKEVFLHHDLKVPLTPSLVKKHRTILQAACEELKEMGYTKLYAYSPCQSIRWKKLCALFGFTETTNPNGVTIFVKET